MPWLRIDDRMYCNRKVVKASLAGKCLWLWAMNYSADQLTDGILQPGEMEMLAGMLRLPDWQTVAQELVTSGLFERDGDGNYLVHDYLAYNPSREEVLQQRRENTERQAEWQARKRATATDVSQAAPNAVTNSVNNAVSKSAPRTRTRTRSLNPVPTPETGEMAAMQPPQAAARQPSQHQQAFGELVRCFGAPANDAERGRYEKAAKLITQAKALGEVASLKAEAERREYPEITPTAIACNVSSLRRARASPKSNGRALTDDFARIDAVAAMVERGGSFFGQSPGEHSQGTTGSVPREEAT